MSWKQKEETTSREKCSAESDAKETQSSKVKPGEATDSAIGNLFTERWKTEGHCCVFYAMGEI